MYGLVLEGGGARGAFQIGAWKALREIGVEIKGISGTSVGALNGAMIIQDDFEKTYDLWYNLSPSQVVNAQDEMAEKLMKLDIKYDEINYLVKGISKLWNDMGIDITPLKELLKANIDEEKIRKSGMDFGITTISLTDMKSLELYIEDIEVGKLINYLMASSRMLIFKQERLDGKLFLDGGYYNKLPIKLLSSKGYKDLIVVKLDKYEPVFKAVEDGLNVSYIKPSEELGRMLDFSQSKIRRNMELGYFDTIKTFQKLKGSKYYVKPKGNESYFLDYFMNLDEATVLRIGKILGTPDMPFRRMLFEYIIPKLAELLGLQKDVSYEEIVLAIFEEAAQRYGIERFKIYSFEDLEDEVLEKFRPSKENLSTKIPRFLKQSDLVLKTFKDDILSEIIDELLGSIAWLTSV